MDPAQVQTNQNQSGQQDSNLAPEQNSAQPFGAPVIAEKKPMGPLIACITLGVLAAGGIGFGIFEFLQNNKKAEEISSLNIKVQNAEQEIATIKTEIPSQTNCEAADSNAETSAEMSTKNPVITDSSEYIYRLFLNTGAAGYLGSDGSSVRGIEISVRNGEITTCETFDANHQNSKECSISGISGKVSQPFVAQLGQAAGEESILFLMEDGTVEYIPLTKAFASNDFSSRGKIPDLNGVVSLHTVSVNHVQGGGYVDTVIYKSDGSYVLYSSLVDQMGVK